MSKFFYILFIVQISVQIASANEVCTDYLKRLPLQSAFYNKESQLRILSQWDPKYFSSPQRYDKSHFRFIYHEISASSGNMGEHSPLFTLNGISKDSYAYQLILDPSKISKNPKISASLIDNNYRKVFSGRIGFFLSVPPENIVATSPVDIGSKSYKRDSIKKLKEIADSIEGGLRTPSQLINESLNSTYNEIILTGTEPLNEREVKIEGIGLPCASLRDNETGYINELSINEIRKILQKCHPFGGELVITFMLEAIDLNKAKYPILLFRSP